MKIPESGNDGDQQKVIWYINHYAGGPGISVSASYRAYELGKNWTACGYKVLVILSSYAGPSFQDEQYPEHVLVDGVEYLTIKTNSYSGNGVGRLLNILLFSMKLYIVSKRIPGKLSNPKVVIYSTVHPFGIFGARYLARKYAAKLVYEVRDLWPLTLTTLLKMKPWSPLVIASRFAQHYSCKHADLVCSVLPKANDYYQEQGIDVRKFVWVPNGAGEISQLDSETESSAFRDAQELIESWRSSGKSIVVHAGAMGPPNMIEEMVDGFIHGATVEKNSTICFLLIGDGILRNKLESRVKKIGLNTVQFTGKLNRAETEKLVAACDIGYLGVRDLPELYKYGISPNKLITYIRSGVAVAMTGRPCGDPVSESGCGIVSMVDSDKDCWDLVKNLAEKTQEERLKMVAAGQAYILKYYDYEKVARDYLVNI